MLTLREGDPQRSSRPAGPPVPLPRSAGGCQPPRGAWRSAIPGCIAPLLLAPCRCQRRRELHAGTRSLRRRGPAAAGRLACSMLPPRRSPAALAAGQKPAPEGGKSWITPAVSIQLASLGQRAPGANHDAGVQRLPLGLDHSQMPVERRDIGSTAGTYSVQLTKHLHCFFEPPGQASALLLRKNFSLLSSWLRGNMGAAEGGTGRLPAALGTEQMVARLVPLHWQRVLPLVSALWTTSAGWGQNPRKQKDGVWSSTPAWCS